MKAKGAVAAVVGAGPAGLMAADVLSAAGARVTIFEAMPSAGRKLLMAGRGGLNLTHSEPLERFLARYGPAEERLAPIVRQFDPEAVRSFAGALGQETFVGSSGRIFPRAMKASPLLRAWLARLVSGGVEFRFRRRLERLERDLTLTFGLVDGARESYRPEVAVLALGGASWPRLGSTGTWAGILGELGIAVTPLQAANVGIVCSWSSHLADRHAGAPLKRIALSCGSERVRGEALLTRSGLEGGAVYALGSAIRTSLERHGETTLFIDLRPDMSAADLAGRLARPRGKASVSAWLRRVLNLAPVDVALLREAKGAALPLAPDDLAAFIKAVPIKVAGMAAIDRAISSAGGVAWSSLDDKLMLKAVPGIFVAGEMIDWDAPTGGYLLQAALATGHAAGEGAVRYLERNQPNP